MKELYITSLLTDAAYADQTVDVFGWLKSRRRHGRTTFLDVTDSTGTIQVVVAKDSVSSELLRLATTTPVESGVRVTGVLSTKRAQPELTLTDMEVIGAATRKLDPQPRSDFDPFADEMTAQVMANRAVYLRNPKIMNVLQFRAALMQIVREWFAAKNFMEFDAPILTPAPLYDDSTAMNIDVHGQSVFLTQCAGFYLEAAAHAFERVFNMGPSFRGEESRSRRHLKEYWHIKAEMTFGDREDIMSLVEDLLVFVAAQVAERCQPQLEALGAHLRPEDFRAPFARITYEAAVEQLQTWGMEADFGVAISSDDEEALARLFDGPFWIVGIPRSVEPFPYVIDEKDPRVTMVADLIAPRGFGELCGVAEKIYDPAMLDERLAEKNKLGDPRYQFVHDVHEAGCVPHIAFGMGLERLIRWLLNMKHVRDTIPLPRPAGRRIDH